MYFSFYKYKRRAQTLCTHGTESYKNLCFCRQSRLKRANVSKVSTGKCIQGQHRTSKSIKTLNSTHQTLIPSSSNLPQNVNPLIPPTSTKSTCLKIHLVLVVFIFIPANPWRETRHSWTSCLQVHLVVVAFNPHACKSMEGGCHSWTSCIPILLSFTIHNRNVNFFS